MAALSPADALVALHIEEYLAARPQHAGVFRLDDDDSWQFIQAVLRPVLQTERKKIKRETARRYFRALPDDYLVASGGQVLPLWLSQGQQQQQQQQQEQQQNPTGDASTAYCAPCNRHMAASDMKAHLAGGPHTVRVGGSRGGRGGAHAPPMRAQSTCMHAPPEFWVVGDATRSSLSHAAVNAPCLACMHARRCS
jgi:hypothetical protein